jgi:hypothetical protein
MNGRIAKQIRRKIYGDKNPRDRSYFATIRTTKLGFLQQISTLFKKRKNQKIIGGITADSFRRDYQYAKKQYKEMRHD